MNLLRMSFSAAIMITVIIILRALWIHRLPKRMFLILWAVAVLRLLVPFSFPFVFSVYSLIPQSAAVMSSLEDTSIVDFLPMDSYEEKGKNDSLEDRKEGGKVAEGVGSTVAAAAEKQNQYQNDTSIPVREGKEIPGWTLVWAVGMLVCALFFFTTYILCYRQFRTSLPVENDMIKEWMLSRKIGRRISVRQSDCISAPLAYGVFHPVILMPKGIKWENSRQMQYILEHEFIHIRRLDAVAKLFLIAAVCIHWFNPMVWVMYILANRDIELSCDEGVIRHFGAGSKSAYALSLIYMEERKSSLMPLGNHFSKNAAEERITAIMKLQKLSLPAYILAAGLVVSVTAAFATSAVAAERGIVTRQRINNMGMETKLSESQQKELLKVYQRYGVSESNGVLYYQNEPIRILADKYLERTSNRNGGTNTNTIRVYSYFNESGTVDVKPIREDKVGKTNIAELYRDVTDIVKIMPTAVENRLIDIPRACINRLARSAVEEGKYANAKRMVPYIDMDVVDEIAEEMIEEGERIDEITAYISADFIGELAEIAYEKWGFSFIRKLLPYVPQESLDRLGYTAAKKEDNTAMKEIAEFRFQQSW